MKLRELIENIYVVSYRGDIDIEISGIEYDSRRVEKGNLFVCVKGFQTDGHLYIQDAIKRGAAALIIEADVDAMGLPAIRVENSRTVMPLLAARFYNFPTNRLNLIGITGTNGKTTTTYLVKEIFEEAGRPTGLLGTISIKMGDKSVSAVRTTQEAIELQKLFSEMLSMGVNDAVMEVSSHSLDLGRVEGCKFSTGVFTNLTQDHLDFHKTIENYRDAKKKLFYKTSKTNIVNHDDEHGRMIIDEIRQLDVKLITYGIDRPSDIMAKKIAITARGVDFVLSTPEYEMPVRINIPGKFSVYNALAAAAAAYTNGIDKESIKRGLLRVTGVPGRSEVVPVEQPYTVMVDYAHTPDGLVNILKSIREYVQGQIITVFGCGGDRDRTKRSEMGRVVGLYTDYGIITSDNPRSEEPAQIIQEVEVGMKETDCAYECIENRREAIRRAMEMATKGDVVLIAGKGHETYQQLKDYTIPFDDREVAMETAAGLKEVKRWNR